MDLGVNSQIFSLSSLRLDLLGFGPAQSVKIWVLIGNKNKIFIT